MSVKAVNIGVYGYIHELNDVIVRWDMQLYLLYNLLHTILV